MGNYLTLTGKADRIDPVFRTLQVGDTVVDVYKRQELKCAAESKPYEDENEIR